MKCIAWYITARLKGYKMSVGESTYLYCFGCRCYISLNEAFEAWLNDMISTASQCWLHVGSLCCFMIRHWSHTFQAAHVARLLLGIFFTEDLHSVLNVVVTMVLSITVIATSMAAFHTHSNLHHRGELYFLVLMIMHLFTWRPWTKTGKLYDILTLSWFFCQFT